MSATQRSLFAVVLLLGTVVASVTPAATQAPDNSRGIWVHTNLTGVPTLTVVNLTNLPLALVTNTVKPVSWLNGADGDWIEGAAPFKGDTRCSPNTPLLCFPIPPYRNVTWKGIKGDGKAWKGALTFLPQGMDPKWTVTLTWKNAFYDVASGFGMMTGDWVFLTADVAANPNWNDVSPYNISCSYPGSYNTMYNVMTISGTDLAVTLYAPSIARYTAPTVDVTLVFRQRWPHTPLANGYQDQLLMPCLNYEDNSIPYGVAVPWQ